MRQKGRRSSLPPLILLALLVLVPMTKLPVAAELGVPTLASPSTHEIYVSGDEIVVATSTLSMALSIPEDGAILNITDSSTGQYLRLNQSLPSYLWGVDDFEGVLTSSQADRFNYSISQDTNATDLSMEWQIPGYYLVDALVQARSDGYVGMKLNVTNLDQGVEIRRVIFPYVGGILGMGPGPASGDFLSIPEREGYVIQNVTHSVVTDPTTLEYPGTLSMQYVYWYQQDDGGIYLGMQDDQSNYKGLEMLKASPDAYSLDWYQYAANITLGNSYQMDYFAMFKGVAGADWSAGAQTYRSWALKQWYVSSGPVAQREDIPTWVKNLDLVWGTWEYSTNWTSDQVYLGGTNSSQMGAFTGQVRGMLPNANLLLYWYGWNQEGFDRGYPDFYPPRDGVQAFQKAIDATHALGIKVMLYFNGRLVDDTTPTYNESLPYLTVNQDGVPYSSSYDNGTLVGGIPAPTTSWWVDTVENFTTTAVKDYGVDGVFLDQSTVASPELDMSTTHGHLPGGGSWWWQSEGSLLESVRNSIREYNPQAIVSSENVNEVYIKDVDLFQSYDWEYDFESLYPQGFTAPLFAYVYHGYALQFTSYLLPFGVHDYAEGSYLEGIAQSMADGYIPGVATGLAPSQIWWFTNQTRAVLETVVRARQAIKQFVVFGTTPPLPFFQTGSNFFLGAPVFEKNLTAPAINLGAFQLSDGREVLVLVNMAGGRSTEDGSFPDGIEGQGGQSYLVTEALDGKAASVLELNGSSPFSVSMPPLSVETLTLETAPEEVPLGGSPQSSILCSSSSTIERAEVTPATDSLSVVVNETSGSGFLHILLPDRVLNFSGGSATRTFLDGDFTNATLFQNSSTTSVVFTYGPGTHVMTIGGPAPPVPVPQPARPPLPRPNNGYDLYIGVGGVLAVALIGLVALGSLEMARQGRRHARLEP